MTPESAASQPETCPASPGGYVIALTCCWIGGLVLGRHIGHAPGWLALSGVCWIVMLIMAVARRPRGVRTWSLVMAVPLAAGWLILHHHHSTANDIRYAISDQPRMVQVLGRVLDQPTLIGPTRGAFADYSYRSPATMLTLEVSQLLIQGEYQSARGRLQVRIAQADHRLAAGDQVRATGWLQPIDPPANPGQFDYRRYLANQGIHAQLRLASRENIELLNRPAAWRSLIRVRARMADAARESLVLNMPDQPQRLAMLQTILLGHGRAGMDELGEAFSRVGLAHLLAISGAHLAILMSLVWALAALFAATPQRTVLVVLAVLLVYLGTVPLNVPIVRASIMAGMFCLMYLAGRRVSGMTALAAACLFVLIWRPADLFHVGFQLSFGVVAGLLLFTRPVGQWLWPAPAALTDRHAAGQAIARRIADYMAVNLVAFGIAWPIVAYHFGFVSPLAAILSFAALPAIVLTLWLGYVKILVGLVLPSGGMVLSWPLTFSADLLAGMVWLTDRVPGSSLDLGGRPTLAWVAACSAVMVMLMWGRFARRMGALAAAVCICVAWLAVQAGAAGWLLPAAWTTPGPVLRVNMLAVGNGSCILVRIRDAGREPFTLMFDCGSQHDLAVGLRAVVPALAHWRVSQIDALMLSHPDLDHYAGVLDLLDHVPIKTVLVPEPTFDFVANQPSTPSGRPTAAQFLLQNLTHRQVPIQGITRGWRQQIGQVTLESLWPTAGYTHARANEFSTVLSIRAAGRHILLTGDIGNDAMTQLLAIEQPQRLWADVMELPHHGAWIAGSAGWIEAVNPQIVFQSAGRGRLADDPWPSLLERRGITRYVTAKVGMVQLDVHDTGTLDVTSHLVPLSLP